MAIGGAEFASTLQKILNRLAVKVNYPLKVAYTDTGAEISFIGQNAGAGGGGETGNAAVPCIITSGTTAAGYAVSLYADGYDNPATGTGTLDILDISIADNLASGEHYIAKPQQLAVTGGNE